MSSYLINHKLIKLVLLLQFLIVINYIPSFADEIRVNNVIIDKKDVFEREDSDWFFAAPFLNFFHSTTKDYIIKDELLFGVGDFIDDDYLFETERNLRRTDLFTKVYIELDSINDNLYDVYVVTKDRWSLYPAILFGSGGGEMNYGARLQEFNLLGTGTGLTLEALHRTENNIGWQGLATIQKQRLFRTELNLYAKLQANKHKTEQVLHLTRPFRTLDTEYSYGLRASNSFGSDFVFHKQDTFLLAPFKERVGQLTFSKAWTKKDRIFATGFLEYHEVDRANELTSQVFDNSGKILLMFSSVAQDFYLAEKINYYHTEDMIVGGYGSATLGKIFSIGSKGEDRYYIAAQGEISYYNGRSYLFGQLTGASAFKHSLASYTYQEFYGLGFTKLTEDFVLTARFHQQTAWNWSKFRQLILDNDFGLRGYAINSLAGENRILSNMELRYFPDIPIWVVNLSGVAFWDIGTVWNQDQKIYNSKFYNSAGLGIRFHFTKSSSPDHTLRVDFAYNFNDRKFGGIILSSQQLFSAFGTHEYKQPEIYGSAIDLE